MDKTRLLPLVCARFQVLFHSPSGVLFTIPSRYYSLSVTCSYLALEDGPPRFNRGFSCPDLLGYPDAHLLMFRLRDSHPLWSAVPGAFCYTFDSVIQGPTTPAGLTPPVWAIPRSLAATKGISFDFFSSRYLDVSVPWVGSFRCWDITPSGFPHSDIPGSKLACSSPRLNAACHVLHRRQIGRAHV